MRNTLKVAWLMELADHDELLEVGRKAVEDALVECRDGRMSELRNNGLVIAEYDGTRSPVIRFGTETAVRIALKAIAEKLGHE